MTAQLAPDLRPACLGEDPERFFPVARSAPELAAARHTAETFCQPCPVRDACRRAGRGEIWGIWGGRLHSPDAHNTVIDLLNPTLPTSPRKARHR